MKIKIAKYAGACYGVNRSIDMLVSACLEHDKVATLGELIHNPKTVALLREKYGVEVVGNVEEAKKCGADAVVIRSHGVAIEQDWALQNSGLQVIDATCPHVKHVQKKAAELASKYDIVMVVGRAGHPEVEGVMSYIKAQGATGICVNDELQFKEALLSIAKKKIGVVSQTTQSQTTFDKILQLLDAEKIQYESVNTICSATAKRQNAAAKAAKSADKVIVLGGKNSSNTAHLAEICSAECAQVYLIDGVDNLQSQKPDFKDSDKVAICAGASTPENQIKELHEYLLNL